VTQLPTNTRALVLGTVDPGKTELLQYLSELCDKEGL
jgi:polynucleotide 5'-kinase involved in rRNA processing